MDRSEAVSPILVNLWAHLPGNCWVIDKEFKLVAVSNAYLDLIEEGQRNIIGKDIFTVFQDKPYARFLGGVHSLKYSLKKVKSSGQEERVTIKVDRSKTSNYRREQLFDLLYRPVMDDNNQVAYIIHEAKEVSLPEAGKRLEAKEIYSESEAPYRTLFNAIDEGFCIIEVIFDENGRPIDYRFLETNEAFEKQTGIHQPIGKRMRELVPDHEDHWFEIYGGVALTGEAVRFVREAKQLINGWYAAYAFRFGGSESRKVAILFNDITEQKNTEKALRESEERLHRMIEIETVGVIFFKPGGQIFDSNDAFLRMSGYQREDFKKGLLRWDVMTPPEYMPRSLKAIDEFLTLGRTTPYEKEYIRKDGSRWWALFAAKRINEEEGVEFIIDISESKQIEKQLRDSEERFRLATEAALIYSWEIDTRTHKFQYSGNAAHTLGFAIRSELPKNLEEKLAIIHPDDRDRVSREFEQALNEATTFVMEYRVVGPSNTVIWLEKHGKVLRDEHHKPMRVIGVAQNITVRKETEEALRQSEEHLRLIMESAKDYAIITLDMNGKITGWNKGAALLLGYKEKEIIGKSGDIIFIPEDRKKKSPEHEMQLAIERGDAENERWHLRKDGSRFWGSGMTMPLLNEEGRLRGFLKIMRDSTEKRQMEETLKQAKEAAEKAANAKEEFLAHMSHEIRTPLNAIVGLSNLLLQRNPREDQTENLQTLKFSSENLMNLINDILDFSKLEAGKVIFEEAEYDLRALLNSLMHVHEFRAREKAIQLHLKVDEQLPTFVKGDQLRLSQILHNLINNAIKFTTRGSVTIELKVRAKEEGHVLLDFSIIDTGIGISKEKQAVIFEKFSQADTSTVREYGGTGLGLTITKMLLGLMSSNIEVESEPGKGTRFFFTLQLKEATVDGAAPAIEVNREERADLRDLKILLVEDVEINRMVVSQFIQDWWGLAPDEAANGKEALEKIKQNDYSLILMDVRMPVMDGYEAARQVRNLPGEKYKHLPIIALTADTRQEFRKDCQSSYFTDIVIKPFDPSDLQQKIMRYAPKRRNSQSQAQFTAVGYDKAEKFLRGDKSNIITFYGKAIAQLDEYKLVFREAMTDRDEKKLNDMCHKATMLINLMDLKDLKAMLKKGEGLIGEEAGSDMIAQIIDEGEVIFDQVIKGIKKRNNNLKDGGEYRA